VVAPDGGQGGRSCAKQQSAYIPLAMHLISWYPFRDMEPKLVTCLRCGHKWATRIDPKRCAGCRSPYWATP